MVLLQKCLLSVRISLRRDSSDGMAALRRLFRVLTAVSRKAPFNHGALSTHSCRSRRSAFRMAGNRRVLAGFGPIFPPSMRSPATWLNPRVERNEATSHSADDYFSVHATLGMPGNGANVIVGA